MSNSMHPWAERRPTRLKVLGVYGKRALLRNFNSKPLISGDLFADNADYVHSPTAYRYNRSWWKSLKSASVIFCPSHDLQDFLTEHRSDIRARVIIAGNSDHDFVDDLRDIPPSVRKLYLQNSFISDNRHIYTLPIGIENLRYGVNGLPKLMNFTSGTIKLQRILMGPFGLTHPDREEAFDYFKNPNDLVDLVETRYSPREYSKLMQSYSFVAAVRGNGVDTHRLWESLYRGCIPILKDDAWSRSLEILGLPLRLVSDWSPDEMRSALNLEHELVNPRNISALWWPYWKSLLNHDI